MVNYLRIRLSSINPLKMSQQNVSQSVELQFEPHTQVEEVVGAQVQKRALRKSYAMYCSFKSLNIAMQYMNKLNFSDRCSEFCLFCEPWRKQKTTKTKTGDKYWYSCKIYPTKRSF